MSFFKKLKELNVQRQKEWDGEGKLNLLFRALEHVAEAGELGNKVKKLWRQQNEVEGSKVDLTEIADEVGDVIITLDLLCQDLGIDIEQATVNKFNKTSAKFGFNTVWRTQPELPYAPHEIRILEEQDEVNTRLNNLNAFLNKGQPEFIDDEDWDLLNAQAFNMRGYNYILLARIRKFKKKYKQQAVA